MNSLEKLRMMQDMALQRKCVEAGKLYVEKMFSDLKDQVLLARIRQAVGAGFAKGFRTGQLDCEAKEGNE